MNVHRGKALSAQLLQALPAALNRRAFALLAGGFAIAILGGAGSSLIENKILSIAGFLSSLLALFYMANATGYLLVREAQADASNRPEQVHPLQALRWSLAHGHALLGVILLIAIGLTALATICGLVLALCKIPGIGAAIYACLLPALILLSGVVTLGAIAIVSLAAPAIWEGNRTLFTLKHLLKMMQRHWPSALGQLGLLYVLLAAVCVIVAIVLGLGSAIAGGLAGKVLFSQVDMLLMPDRGFELAGNIGSTVAWGVGALFPILALIAGLCRIHLYTLAWFAPVVVPVPEQADEQPGLPASQGALLESHA